MNLRFNVMSLGFGEMFGVLLFGMDSMVLQVDWLVVKLFKRLVLVKCAWWFIFG